MHMLRSWFKREERIAVIPWNCMMLACPLNNSLGCSAARARWSTCSLAVTAHAFTNLVLTTEVTSVLITPNRTVQRIQSINRVSFQKCFPLHCSVQNSSNPYEVMCPGREWLCEAAEKAVGETIEAETGAEATNGSVLMLFGQGERGGREERAT